MEKAGLVQRGLCGALIRDTAGHVVRARMSDLEQLVTATSQLQQLESAVRCLEGQPCMNSEPAILGSYSY